VRAVEAWIVDLSLTSSQLERCAAILDRAEGARARRFLRAPDRARFVASHAALRAILAEALNARPAAIRLEAGSEGKPTLPDKPGDALAFNLSHSGQRALIGIARGAAIGVDVEIVRSIPDALRIARAHFASDEVAALAAMPPGVREACFFGLWTRKEAIVKATGSGLSLPLDRFSVSVPPAPPCLLRGMGGGAWSMAAIDCGAGYAATLAVRTADAPVTCRHLPDDWPDHLV
jgi:4'-phosphopantetheinyl transferase